MNIREIALKLLMDYEECGKYVNLSLNSHIADGLGGEDRARLTALLYTTVEHKLTYDYYIAALSGRGIEKLTDHTKCILRLGLCQIVDMDNIPDFAAVNETVKLAKNPGERSLVNGILRRAVREKGSLPLPKKEKNAARYYSVAYSLPLATVKHFIGELGEDETVKLFETFNSQPPISLTVNTLKISVDDFISELEKQGYTATRVKFSPITVTLSEAANPRKIKGFEEGWFYVQDEASAIAALALSAKSGDTVIDVCSAPGGKSFASAILSSDKARIHSFDLHESKLSLITDTADRLGIRSVTASVRDALTPDESLIGRADKLLCDVPCSGLGVIAKKPDLRYKDISATTELPPLQLDILTASSRYLKKGGELVYSTCTLNPRENAEVVHKFLDQNPDFTLVDFSVGSLKSEDGVLTLWPHIHNTDGFFISKLRKNK
jgi:16S rRNA (cytosine967-C5)-methyltransferase